MFLLILTYIHEENEAEYNLIIRYLAFSGVQKQSSGKQKFLIRRNDKKTILLLHNTFRFK
jgi:hypothetical protein